MILVLNVIEDLFINFIWSVTLLELEKESVEGNSF